MAKNDDFRDSIEKSREALRDHQDHTDIDDDARRDAVRAVVADLRSGSEVGRPAPTALMQDSRPLHPFFQGLLDCLPPPGEAWPTKMRDQWLDTARNIFALLYSEVVEAEDLQAPRVVMRSVPAEEDATASYERPATVYAERSA